MDGKKVTTLLKCFSIFFFFMMMLSGCSVRKGDPMEKVQDLEYTVMAAENIPDAVLKEAEQRKEKEFKLTFRDGENLYVCMGYGKQETGGYSIRVLEFYEAGNGIYVSTELMGPEPGQDDTTRKVNTYPYIVLKTEYRDKPVIFL